MNTTALRLVIALGLASALSAAGAAGQSRSTDPSSSTRASQKIDAEYTAKIKEYLQDPRITTELVDHLPASDTVPTPLKFLGRVVGQPGELTYAKDIHRYYEALAKASPRARYWKIGTTEEGRDMVALAIADEATIKSLDKHKDMLGALTDPRKTTDAQAQQLLKTAKPIYYLTSGMHSPENGGPEMLIELAYRLIVEETPFIQNIRNNVITLITPVIEVDGREKQVDTYYFNKTRAQGDARLPLMYWGKYVQHDNNRDGMGQFLELTKAVTRVQLEWHPTVMHDLHEAQTYLYSSTGTGPYNDALDPITIGEWWQFAQNDVDRDDQARRARRLDLRVLRRLGAELHVLHRALAQRHRPLLRGAELRARQLRGAARRERHEQGVVPAESAARRRSSGVRATTPTSSSRACSSRCSHVAKNRETYLENYWLKNKRSIDEGKNGPIHAGSFPRRSAARPTPPMPSTS